MRPYGPAALRLCVGAVFLAHGAQKLFSLWNGPGLTGTAAFFTSLGLPYAYPLAILVGFTEFAGGALLILGGLTRWVALALAIDMGGAEARVAGQKLNLTRREFDLLAFLTQNVGRVYSRTELLDRVWGADFLGGERTVDQHITQLRSHLADDSSKPAFLETVRGKGYRMRPWAAEK